MSSLRQFQQDFAEGLLGASAIETYLARGTGYAVHVRNIRNSLVLALKHTYPVVCELVGPDFFAGAARRFIASFPPSRPWLTSFGAEFPSFLASYGPASPLPFLPDCAALEWARIVAAFSPDELGIDLASLSEIPESELMKRQLILHRCATIVPTRFPAYRIWAAHQAPNPGRLLELISLDPVSEVVLVSRSVTGEAVVSRFSGGRATFLRALSEGESLASAWALALEDDSQFELAMALAELADLRAFRDDG